MARGAAAVVLLLAIAWAAASVVGRLGAGHGLLGSAWALVHDRVWFAAAAVATVLLLASKSPLEECDELVR